MENQVWQLCPKCNGNGTLPYFNSSTTNACPTVTCDVCHGGKIISTLNGLPPSNTFVNPINSQPRYTSVGRPVDLEPIKEGVPVMENSNAFIQWLYSQNIEHRPDGNRTIILGNRDMFEIGRAWVTYSFLQRAKEEKPILPKTKIESTPLGDIEVPE